jgi:hypothetical protein
VSLFSAAFLDECRKGIDLPGAPEIYPLLQMDLPSGPRRLAKANVASASLGAFEPLVQEWGSVTRSVDPRASTLQSTEASPVISDILGPGQVGAFGTEVARYRRSLRLSPCSIVLASPNVAPADWYTVFTGILDSPEMVKPFSWRLNLKTNDAWLQFGVAPKPAFTPSDWPNAAPEVYGNFVPIIYGIHDSNGTGTHGMLPTFYVDTAGWRYAIGLGQLHLVRAVYADGTLVSTADYQVEFPVNNGVQYTVLHFTSDQGAAAITCDVEGLTDDGLAGGALLLDPAAQFLHFLTVFAYNDWRSGPYPSTSSAPLHADSFTSVGGFLTQMGHEGSRYLGGQEQVRILEELQTFLGNHELRAYWRGDGKLALAVNDHRPGSLYYVSAWLKGTIDSLKDQDLKLPLDSNSLLREVTLQFVHGEVSGKYHQTLRVQDLSVPDTTSRALALIWSAARVV